ncbi:MAG: TIR domain-containing protein [Sphingomicrobium sp.]
MSDVFVSYKAEDRRRVRSLVEALEADGYSVWWDEQIGGGAAWRQAIEVELNAAKCVIVAWSKRSVGAEGTFVQDEAARAQHRHVYVPVTIDKVQVPLGFGEMQALPLTGWKGDRSEPRYQAVLAAIRRVGGEASATAPRQLPQTAVSRRTMVAGGAVAAAAVAGSGAWYFLKPSSGASDSIAVLPFENLSRDPDQAYFSDGIAEELRGALASLAGLKVVGRTSSEAVKSDDAETAARKLNVANILIGSVRQSSSTIRVAAQLIDGSNGLEHWSQSYDRVPGDAIKIQTDIAESVARALSITIGTAARRAITVGGTQNPAAQKLFFQAMEAARRNDKQALQQGISFVDEAIKLDPNYADAYAHKALFTNWYAGTYATDVPELVRMRADAAETGKVALRLAPGLASGHRALAEIHRSLLHLGPAIREYRRALALAPGDSGTLADLAFVIGVSGNSAEAVRLSDQAIDLDPLNISSYYTRFFALVMSRRFEEAVSFSQGLERTKPYLFDWPAGVAYALIVQNKLAEAEAYQQKAPADNYNRLVNEAVIFSRTGKRDGIPAIVAKLHQFYGDAASYQYGQLYAQLGDKERAFAALDRAWQIRDSGLLKIKVDPYMAPLRADPRYKTLLEKLNFPA